MSFDADACVIGSGAGGGPVALRLAEAGLSVVVLEKGPHLVERDFTKDEIAECRRTKLTPSLRDEPHVIEVPEEDGPGFTSFPSHASPGWNLWHGCLVGGATNVMSGFFHRMKPIDFRLRSELGPVAGADVADWPITYEELEPWYALVEREVGVSGRVTPHPFADRRSTPDFPFAPLAEHPVAGWVDRAAERLGQHAFPLPRAILSEPSGARAGCRYAGFCGGYGCDTGAKGSSRAALLVRAVVTGRCDVRPRAMVVRVESDARGRAVAAEYVDERGELRRVTARVFVIACGAIESARLLLASTGPKHPRGLANRSGLVGRNLLFSVAGAGHGELPFDAFHGERARELRSRAPFVNRAVQDGYVLTQDGRRVKGGTTHYLFAHPNPIDRAVSLAYGPGGPVWGKALAERLVRHFRGGRRLAFEVFAEWLPGPDTRVTLDPSVRDRFGRPVARVRVRRHPQSDAACRELVARAVPVLRELGARDARGDDDVGASTNLAGGTCRFGRDPARSVLDPSCRAHDVENLFVTDGSFLPSGGGAPFTWTIYANAFRVADVIARQLGTPGG